MGIFSRMTDIVNSNINALLDRAEDPEKMVRLIIQEMEETLVEVRTTSARTIAEKKELSRRKEHLDKDLAEWERKAEVAIGKGRDDLAKAALAERRRVAENADALDLELEHLETSLAKLSEDIGALQQKIKDAKTRQKAILLRGKSVQTRLDVKRHLHNDSIEDAMVRFELYERKMDDLEGQVEAYDLGQRSLADQIEELEKDEALDAELQELKARISKPAVPPAVPPADQQPSDQR